MIGEKYYLAVGLHSDDFKGLATAARDELNQLEPVETF